MKKTTIKNRLVATIACAVMGIVSATVTQGYGDGLQSSVPQVRSAKTHVVPAFWAQMPKLKAKTTVKILDVNGPGIVTMIHASKLVCASDKQFSPDEVIIRVFYDGETKPSIEMPYMDFLANIQGKSELFSTIYFSKVKDASNFRLQMPFRKSIVIAVENTSETDLRGSADIQWDELSSLPENTPYLYVDYKSGNVNPKEPLSLFELNRPAIIVAHWLQYESVKSHGGGEVICEANQELYLDGDQTPTLNYLGTEDVYAFSWGFKGIQSDIFSAIIRRDAFKPPTTPVADSTEIEKLGGSRVAVLRCRERDTISFQQSCKWVLTFLTDPKTVKTLSDHPLPYRHCVYYYSNNGKPQ